MQEYDNNKPNAMDWAKLLFTVLVTLGLGYGLYLSAPYIGKALLSDGSSAPVTPPAPPSPQEEKERRGAAQIKYIGEEKKAEVAMRTEMLIAENRVDDNVLYVKEIHCQSTKLDRDQRRLVEMDCKLYVQQNYDRLAFQRDTNDADLAKYGDILRECIEQRKREWEADLEVKERKGKEEQARHERMTRRKYRKR